MRENRFIAVIAVVVAAFIAPELRAQVDARLLRDPDVSSDRIVFSYAGDIWMAAKDGGTAWRLSSAKGEETQPRFSPDGKHVAFRASYDGNQDIYVMPVTGGIPRRVTNHGMTEGLVDWTPDGRSILFSSPMESGNVRFMQFYRAPADGGLPEKLSVPYGEKASLSPDGGRIAYTPLSMSTHTWKRYRGGMAPDIWIFDLKTLASERIAPDEAVDEFPMWRGDRIYFLSDRGPGKRANIWVYETRSGTARQVTKFRDLDIHSPAMGPAEIIFEAGGRLYLLALSDEAVREVEVKVVTDSPFLRPRRINVSGSIPAGNVSAPNGDLVLMEARGEIFRVPAGSGPVVDMTATPGAAERYPAWSPDGKSIAYWSDAGGEYELVIADAGGLSTAKTVTSYGPGYRYRLFWSPDGGKIAFVTEKREIRIFDIKTGGTVTVGRCGGRNHDHLNAVRLNWSPDSRWLVYSRPVNDRGSAIFAYEVNAGRSFQLTSGYYEDSSPVFDPAGRYLYYLTSRTFAPLFSNFDASWIFVNSTNIALVPLTEEVPSPFLPKDDGPAKGPAPAAASSGDIRIAVDGFEKRMVLLPVEAGNYGGLKALPGKVIYQRYPNTGSRERTAPVLWYDLDRREEQTIIDNTDLFEMSADGTRALVGRGPVMAVIDVAPGQRMDRSLPTDRLEMTIDPRAEWKQIFNEVWRLERDFFYDPGMHGVDWAAMRIKYGRLIEDCATREDVNYVIGELIGELNAGHTYRGGGDMEEGPSAAVGYLGVDWEVSGGAYRIKRIVEGAPWDGAVRSPLQAPGTGIKAGDYILAVNGRPLPTSEAPWGVFAGLAGQTVELTVNDKPSYAGARKVSVQTLHTEQRLRELEWMESNRRRVAEASGGRLGYIYVTDTGYDGLRDFYRQYLAQYDKSGLVIDERFNGGGQIPERFIELLSRRPLAYLSGRHDNDFVFPTPGNAGPKVMLINGWSGSGGDAFPWFFRQAGLGPIIGQRTWGGLIGISGSPNLIDGGWVTVPSGRFFGTDGRWFKEGHGVEPDIIVLDDPSSLARGIDPQLERGIQEALKMLKNAPPASVVRPAYEKR